jgi:hypothetical protein
VKRAKTLIILAAKEKSMTSQSTPPNAPLFDPGALLRATVPPILVWGAVVVLASLGGYPGAACMTPMAWLLALWTGMHYASAPRARPDRWPALGPALAGAILGGCLGLLFFFANIQMMAAETDPAEIARGQGLAVVIAGASILGCAVLSVFGAVLIWRRLRQR